MEEDTFALLFGCLLMIFLSLQFTLESCQPRLGRGSSVEEQPHAYAFLR